MSTRIQNAFSGPSEKRRVIPFIMAGDPDLETTLRTLHILADTGADIIEIGVPFSDPVADGPTIQQAGLRALKNGVGLHDILLLIKRFRETNEKTAIVLMGYYNPIYRYACDAFCLDAEKAGVDGLIIVDLPPEEEDEILPHACTSRLDLIRLITPNMTDERLERIAQNASGFLYYVSVAGTTGDKSIDYSRLDDAVSRIRRASNLPIAVGFGIKSRQDVTQVLASADAAVIGSELIKRLNADGFDTNTAKAFFSELTRL